MTMPMARKVPNKQAQSRKKMKRKKPTPLSNAHLSSPPWYKIWGVLIQSKKPLLLEESPVFLATGGLWVLMADQTESDVDWGLCWKCALLLILPISVTLTPLQKTLLGFDWLISTVPYSVASLFVILYPLLYLYIIRHALRNGNVY